MTTTKNIICLGIAVVCLGQIIGSDGKDRFNIYKGEIGDAAGVLEEEKEPKTTYFYRTPPLGYNNMGLKIGSSAAEFGKRMNNRFKNYMLGKENLEAEMMKRGPESLMYWALKNGENYNFNGDNSEKYQ